MTECVEPVKSSLVTMVSLSSIFLRRRIDMVKSRISCRNASKATNWCLASLHTDSFLPCPQNAMLPCIY